MMRSSIHVVESLFKNLEFDISLVLHSPLLLHFVSKVLVDLPTAITSSVENERN